LRDTLSTFWIAMIGYWVIGIGVGGWLTFPMGFGAAGLWWGLVAGAIISIVLMSVRFRKQLALAECRLSAATA